MQRLGAAVQQCRGRRVFDYVGQRAVEVEEHYRSTSRNQFFQLAVTLQSIWECRHGGVTGSHRELSEVGYHSVGSAGQQFLGTPVPVETNNEAESARAGRHHTELVRLDHHAAIGTNTQAMRGLDQDSRIEFCPGVSVGDSHADKFVDARGVQSLGAVAAGRVDGRSCTDFP